VQYDPERYIHDDLTAGECAAHPDVSKRDHFSFGGGRRICPGLHLAERSIFVNLARLLWGFELALAKDRDGNVIPVDFTKDGLVPGALSNVKPFKCCMTPPRNPCYVLRVLFCFVRLSSLVEFVSAVFPVVVSVYRQERFGGAYFFYYLFFSHLFAG